MWGKESKNKLNTQVCPGIHKDGMEFPMVSQPQSASIHDGFVFRGKKIPVPWCCQRSELRIEELKEEAQQELKELWSCCYPGQRGEPSHKLCFTSTCQTSLIISLVTNASQELCGKGNCGNIISAEQDIIQICCSIDPFLLLNKNIYSSFWNSDACTSFQFFTKWL